MGFSRQEYWSGLPWPSPGDLPDPETEPRSSVLQADSLLSEPPREAQSFLLWNKKQRRHCRWNIWLGPWRISNLWTYGQKHLCQRKSWASFRSIETHMVCMSERVPVLIYQCSSEKYDRNVSSLKNIEMKALAYLMFFFFSTQVRLTWTEQQTLIFSLRSSSRGGNWNVNIMAFPRCSEPIGV